MAERFPLRVNGHDHEIAAEPDTPLLYVLRNDLKLKGTRFGCGGPVRRLHRAPRRPRGGVRARSWEDYPILRFDETPEIEVVVVGRPQDPALGAGECAAGPTAAAIANALDHALGVRARHLPLTPERIARAMDAA